MSNGNAPARPANESDEHTGVLDGLTKREKLAARAMRGLLAASHRPSSMLAESSVEMADALLAELEKPQ